MLPVLRLGPLTVPTAGLLLILGVWAGSALAEGQARRRGLPGDPFGLALTAALLAGVAGARLSYALAHLPAYAARPLDVLSLHLGAFDPWGGALAGALAFVVILRRRGLPLAPALDALAPGLALLGAFAGLAALASGTAFGAPTTLPWGIDLWEARRHPTQLYSALGFAALTLALSRHRPARAGQTAALGTAVAAATVLAVEGLRADSTLIAGVRSVQPPALTLGLAALWLYGRLARSAAAGPPDLAPTRTAPAQQV